MKIKQRLGPSFRPGIPAAIVAITALTCASGMAQVTLTWDGIGGTGSGAPVQVTSDNWSALSPNSSFSNWDPNSTPQNNDSLIFAGSIKTTNNNDTDDGNTYNISFASDALPFTLNGNSVTVGGGGIINNSLAGQTFGTLPLILTPTSGAFNAASGNLTVNSVISGAGGLTKTGGEKLTLSNTNTYTGDTNINAGTLLLSGSLDVASTVRVNTGGTLAGGGMVNGTVVVNTGGTVAPGNGDVEELHVGDTTFNIGSIFSWNLDVTDPTDTDSSTNYDRLTGASTDPPLPILSGSGATFAVVGQDYSAPFWSVDQVWTDIFTGFEPGFNLATIFSGGVTSDVSPSRGFFTVSGTNLNYTAVPEPTTALAGMLLAAGILRRRRK